MVTRKDDRICRNGSKNTFKKKKKTGKIHFIKVAKKNFKKSLAACSAGQIMPMPFIFCFLFGLLSGH